MAFEHFIGEIQAAPRQRRRLVSFILTLGLGLHVVLISWGVYMSWWNVEELSPPTVNVTFLTSAPPPPPPPPPPKKKKSETKTKVIPTEVVQPRPNQIVQPKEKPPEPEEEDEGVEGGVEGGVAGGVVGGTVGSVGEGPKMLAPNIGTGQLAINPSSDPYKPRLAAALNRPGMSFWGLYKICVTETGSVKDVKMVKSADPLVDNDWMNKIKTLWKYKPYSINGRPVPFCYTLRLQVTSQQ